VGSTLFYRDPKCEWHRPNSGDAANCMRTE
jgi:hypothetical protein